jgi:hypothetical protein
MTYVGERSDDETEWFFLFLLSNCVFYIIPFFMMKSVRLIASKF